MKLYLFRHGTATGESEPTLDDADPGLTEKSRARLSRAVSGLREMNVDPEVILTSPARRAKETTEILARGLGVVSVEEFVDLDSDGKFEPLVQSFRHYLGLRSVALVGHERSLSQLASFFLTASPTGCRLALKKGSIAFLRGELSEDPPNCTLQWLLPLKVLRRL